MVTVPYDVKTLNVSILNCPLESDYNGTFYAICILPQKYITLKKMHREMRTQNGGLPWCRGHCVGHLAETRRVGRSKAGGVLRGLFQVEGTARTTAGRLEET